MHQLAVVKIAAAMLQAFKLPLRTTEARSEPLSKPHESLSAQGAHLEGVEPKAMGVSLGRQGIDGRVLRPNASLRPPAPAAAAAARALPCWGPRPCPAASPSPAAGVSLQ